MHSITSVTINSNTNIWRGVALLMRPTTKIERRRRRRTKEVSRGENASSEVTWDDLTKEFTKALTEAKVVLFELPTR